MKQESKGVYVQIPALHLTLEQHILLEITKSLVSGNARMGFQESWHADSIIKRAKEISNELLIKH